MSDTKTLEIKDGADSPANATPEKETPKAAPKKANPLKPVILVDKDGNEQATTQVWYEKNKESFDLAGLTKK